MNKVKFSILIPAYKAAYLKECIDSILSQSYPNFELVIVNDHSPENLTDIIKAYEDDRILYHINDKNIGALNVVDNWNKCLGLAVGDYVICMGDDDKLMPNCLEEYAKLLEKYPDIGLLHGWTEIIDENSTPVKITMHRCEYESALSLMWHRMFSYTYQYIGDFCFNRKWLLENGGFYKLPLAWGSDDISAFIGASKNGVANTQTVVFQYRVNSQTITNTGTPIPKLLAVHQEIEWKEKFVNEYDCKNDVDILYKQDLLKNLKIDFHKKQSHVLAADMRRHKYKMFYWLANMGKFSIQSKTILLAFGKSLLYKN